MNSLVDSDVPFEQERCGVQEAERRFRLLGLTDRVDLLETFWHQTIRLVHFGGTTDILHGPVPPSAGYLTHFGLATYPPGFVLRFPGPGCTDPLDCAPANQTLVPTPITS